MSLIFGPLLPARLRIEWAGELMPERLCHECKLPILTKVEELDGRHELEPRGVKRLRRYFAKLLHARAGTTSDLPVLVAPLPTNFASLPWKVRTRHCLEKAGLLDDPQRLGAVTFGELLRIPSMGTMSVLDFALGVEVGAQSRMEVLGQLSAGSESQEGATPTVRPLLPASLRAAWVGEPLPDWICHQCHLPPGTRLDELGHHLGLRAQDRERLASFVERLVKSRVDSISGLRALTSAPPPSLALDTIPWATRTRNALEMANLLGTVRRAFTLTFGELLAVRSMGLVSALDFATAVEFAIAAMPAEPDSAVVKEVIEAPWVDLISGEDARFSDLLEIKAGTLQQQLEAFSSAGDRLEDSPELLKLAQVLPTVKARVAAIDGLKLDAAVRQLLAATSGATGKRLTALLARVGFGESPPATLEESAQILGVTRERLRQIQGEFVKRLPSHPVYLPALDRALEVLGAAAPIDATEAAQLMVSEGISQIPYHPESVIALAELGGRHTAVTVERVGGRARVVAGQTQVASGRVLSVALRQASAIGVTNVANVSAALETQGYTVTEENVRDLLLHYSDAQFLEEDWFWFSKGNPERNRLYNTTRAILSVASPLDISTIREGVRRKYRFRALPFVPPRSVMIAFYRANQAFRVDELGNVSFGTPLDYRQVLGATEQIVVDALRTSPTGLMARETLWRECEARGLNANTLSIWATYSPILEHVSTSIWALRGIRVDPAALEALRKTLALRPRERRVIDHGWTPEGKIWLAARLPAVGVSISTIGIPAAIAPYVLGRRFRELGPSGENVGTIGINEAGGCWGFSRFLRRVGADEGDVLVMTFDLAKETAELRISGEEELQELSQ